MQHEQVRSSAGNHRIGAAIIVAKLDKYIVAAESFNNSAHLSARQSLGFVIVKQCDRIQHGG